LGRSIGRTAKLVRAWGDRALAPINSSVTEWILLFHIASEPSPGMSQTEIARFSDMGGPALVRHLDRLEREGIVQRTRDESDRRVMRVTITKVGLDRLDEIAAVMARCDEQLRSLLTTGEQEVLQTALDKLFEFTRNELHGIPTPQFDASGGPS
jgi:MarR family transcriptional regulator for hemolysin